jgi:integrase
MGLGRRAAVSFTDSELAVTEVQESLSQDDFQLPDPRKVNAELRRQRQKEKEQERMARGGDGMFRKPLATARVLHAGDPIRQIDYLFSIRTIPAAKGRPRFLGDKRFSDMPKHLIQFVRMLPALRCPIQNMSELGIAHVAALVRAWQDKGLSGGCIQNYVSILRRFFCLAGKPKVIPEGEKLSELLRARGLALEGRQYIPELEKGWRDLGHDPLQVIEQIRKDGHPVVACQLEMLYAWGLRDNEAFHLRPAESERETNGAGLSVTRGTKGGKHRTVYYFTRDLEFADYQRQALERAKSLAALHPRLELSVPGMTLKRMKNRFHWVMRKYGIHKKALGITPHGLRHQFACDLFQDVCGLPAPVLGLLPAAAYTQHSESVTLALSEVSRQLGHERKTISSAYVGSSTRLGKTQVSRIKASLKKIEPATGAFLEQEVQEAWIVDTWGRGGLPQQGEPMKIAVRLGDQTLSMHAAAQRLQALKGRLERATGLQVRVVAWLDSAPPEEGTEILFGPGRLPQTPQAAG